MTNKHQVPVLGGLRKVIRTGDNATPGTTIAEIGDQTVTLAQLAALIGAIQAQNTNPGTPVASIALGPGLSGGGPVVGVVPIRLDTLPSVMFDAGGGSDAGGGTEGFMIPGPAGARGLPGQASFYIPDDGEDAPWIPGQPGPRGAQGLQGATGIEGAAGEDALMIPGIQGPAGPQGPQGIPGAGGSGSSLPGFPGEDGEDGLWLPGPIGLRGPQGIQGATGLEGDSGDDALMIPGPSGTSGAGTGGANPTALVGLTPVNGIATTFLRSDGAPALDQSIAPTWTGDHVFNGTSSTPMTVGGIVVTGGVSQLINNTSTISGDTARITISAGSNNTALLIANQNQAAAIVTGGPTGPQAVLRNLGNYPLVFGTSNTYRGQISGAGAWFIPSPSSGSVGLTINGAGVNDTLHLDTDSGGQYAVLGFLNTGTLKAQIFWDNVNSFLRIGVPANGLVVNGTTGASAFSGNLSINNKTPYAGSAGWGTPTGTSVIANFPGATATLAQTSAVTATILAILKNFGLVLA